MKFPPYFEYLKDLEITWFNPCWGYYGFWERLSLFQQEMGVDFLTAWTHRKMKRNKEIYAVAMAALSMRKDVPTKYGWWFTKPKHDPPDGLIATMIEDRGNDVNILHGREVEVMEYFSGSLLDAIKRKLKNKNYEENTILVCLLSPEKMSIFDFRELSEKIRKESLPLDHIFLVGHGFSGNSTGENIKKAISTLFIQLLPSFAVIKLSPNTYCKEFKEGKEAAWLRFDKIGKGTGLKKVTVKSPPKLFD
jgi:hypothetical protein